MFIFNKKNTENILIFFLASVFTILIFKHISYSISAKGDESGLPIIMYHNISEKHNLLGKYTVSKQQFENDLKFIKENGYETITMEELINYVYNNTELPQKPIIISFDDSYESFYEYAYPLLQKYNMKAVNCIVGNYTDLYTSTEDHNLDYSHLNWEEVKQMSESGFVEIQNHTYNLHELKGNRKGSGRIKGESIEQYKKVFTEDLLKLQEAIYKNTGKKPNTFAYPYGYISEGSKDFLKEMGFKAALTCTEVVNYDYNDKDALFNLGRFNRANGKSSEAFFKKILNNN